MDLKIRFINTFCYFSLMTDHRSSHPTGGDQEIPFNPIFSQNQKGNEYKSIPSAHNCKNKLAIFRISGSIVP